MYRLQSLLPLLALLSGTLAVPLLEPELERRQDASPASSTARIATGVTAVPIAATATGTATGGAAGTSYLSPVPVPPASSRRAVSSVYVATSRSAAAIATSSAASAAGTGYTVRPQPSDSSSPENPCGIPQNVLDEYDYLNAQIALRYGPAPSETVTGNDTESADTTRREVGGTVTRSAQKKQRHNKLANTLQCLHPGPAVQDPNAPSIGLYGGLGLQLLPCEDAYYRWSIKEDGGVVVGNGYRPLWALNAEESAEGGNLTIREVSGASNNQSFILTDSGKLRLSSNTTDEALCVAVADGSISLQECSDDDKDEEQTFVILLLPRPRPISMTSSSGSSYRSAATPAGSLVRSSAADSTPSSVDLAARQVVVTGTGEAATGVTATGIAATSSAAAAVGSGVRSAAASRVQSSVSRAAGATATRSGGSGVASGSSPTRTSLPVGCPAGYYW